MLKFLRLIKQFCFRHKKLPAQEEKLVDRQLEIELLKEKMNAAITALKSSELGMCYHSGTALYALPWFMIIGSAASGKSTLLRNSGLHFPFANREDIHTKDFGGTHNCDWWFADEAVILDTAGRYTSEENDKEEWLGFLRLLKKYRPRLPINGIIITVNLIDLLIGEAEGIAWYAKTLRDRIAELYRNLGFIFPIYLIFTKVDLLKGFDAYFSYLNGDERQQAWGFDLIGNSENYIERTTLIMNKLQSLYIKLTQLRLRNLAGETDLVKKVSIYDFPEQFRGGFSKLNEFINLLFKTNPYQEMPKFCGVYFTSGTQEGKLIRRQMDNVSGLSKYNEEAVIETTKKNTENRSYFTKSLFSQIIFANQNLAAKTPQRLQIQHWLKSASILAAGMTIVVTFMLYSTALTTNTLLIYHGERVAKEFADAYNTKGPLSNQTIDTLLVAYGYYQSLVDYRQQMPWYLRLGLYRGNSQIELIQAMLIGAMRPSFLIPIERYLQQTLRNYSQQWETDNTLHAQLRGPYYTLFKAYLMLGFPARIDVDQTTAILSQAWAHLLSNPDLKNNEQQQVLARSYMGLVHFYLNQLHKSNQDKNSVSAKHVDTSLVTQVRTQLYLPANAYNLYAQLRSIADVELVPATLRELMPDNGANLLNNEQLAGMYTVNGWRDYIKPTIEKIANTASQGDWVMQTPIVGLNQPMKANAVDSIKKQQLTEEIHHLYFVDYAQAWFKFLAGIRIAHFGSLEDAVAQLKILSNINGPLTQLLHTVAVNMNIKDNLGNIPELAEPFAVLQSMLALKMKKIVSNTDLKSYCLELLSVHNELQRLATSSDQKRDSQQYASHLLSDHSNDLELSKAMVMIRLMVNGINNAAARTALQSVLLQPIREAWRAILVNAVQGMQQQWQTQVYSSYQQKIANKFPLTVNATQDIAVTDLIEFFQPKTGILWAFINNNLVPYLYLNTSEWQEQRWLDVEAGFSPSFLRELSQARQFSDNLFKNSDNQLGFSYELYPEPTFGITQIIFVGNGQELHYRNGPQQWQTLIWSGQLSNQSSELTVTAASGPSPDALEFQGIWGLFHLLSHAQLISEQGGYRATWTLKNGKKKYAVNLLLRSDSNGNIFQQIMFDKWFLPSTFLIP